MLTGEELVDHEPQFLWEFEEGKRSLAHRGFGGRKLFCMMLQLWQDLLSIRLRVCCAVESVCEGICGSLLASRATGRKEITFPPDRARARRDWIR